MRNKTFISSMVGVAAAAAVAGSANAGVVIDPFAQATLSQFKTLAGSAFNSRETSTSTGFSVNTATNRLVVNTVGGTSAQWRNWGAPVGGGDFAVGPYLDLSQLDSITFDVSMNSASSFSFSVRYQTGDTGALTTQGQLVWTDVAVASGNSTVTLTVGQNSGGTYSVIGVPQATTLSNVSTMRMAWSGAFNGEIGNLQYNNVPAPGALALLGVAGIVGARRRRA